MPKNHIVGLLGGVAINTSAYGEELIRCIQAKEKGLEGVDTPKASRELYAG